MDIQEINVEIEKLEQSETNYQNCSKLAVLYSIRDHYRDNTKMARYSYGSSEFLLTVSEAPMDGVLNILDEHMDAIQLLHPKEYTALINKIKRLY